MGIFRAILGFISKPVTALIERGAIKKKAQAEQIIMLAKAEMTVKIAKAEAQATIIKAKAQMQVDKQASELQWENTVASQMQGTWKDEYLLLFYTTIFAGLFVPFLRPFIEEGFAAAGELPQWYIWTLTAITGATFGLRAFTKLENVQKTLRSANNGREEKEEETSETQQGS